MGNYRNFYHFYYHFYRFLDSANDFILPTNVNKYIFLFYVCFFQLFTKNRYRNGRLLQYSITHKNNDPVYKTKLDHYYITKSTTVSQCNLTIRFIVKLRAISKRNLLSIEYFFCTLNVL